MAIVFSRHCPSHCLQWPLSSVAIARAIVFNRHCPSDCLQSPLPERLSSIAIARAIVFNRHCLIAHNNMTNVIH
jgi:hypothetical protein